MQRRTFLKIAGAAASVGAAQIAVAAPTRRIALVTDPQSPVIASPSVAWALQKLRSALSAKGATVVEAASKDPAALTIVLAAPNSQLASSFGQLPALTAPETTALFPGKYAGGTAILISGVDARGFVYGILDLADRVGFGTDPLTALHLPTALVETSPNKVRSVARSFCSEVEDKSWYYDREFWSAYLDTLAASRFNRFNFAFGFSYDFPKGVTSDYFHFPYPYLVEVPGYEHVHVEPALQPGEREHNLETLKFIAAETARRGLEFQLGIWTHAYEWTDSPHSDHHILGLNSENHGLYCRDALSMLLKECPQITGVTLRVHGESGVPEGSYPFWQTLYEAFPKAGRPIEIDMHAKGINQIMIDMARKTGMPVKVGAKYSAEHQSLSYHQADIRELEIPRADRIETGIFSVSNGERRFTRYGYADLYQQDSGYEVLYRLWPGTQHHLLWGDPAQAAGFGRTSNFCGAAGLEICESLTFKGREGSGHPGGRNAYADKALEQNGGRDTAKFDYTFRVLGRLLFNPDATPQAWHAFLRQEFGPAAASLEVAIASTSRILPLITSAFLPSASNHTYWPEMYTNLPIVPGSIRSPYNDTPKPYSVGTCSPLDPQLFSTVNDHAKDLLAGKLNPRYSPVEVAQWLEGFATVADKALASARSSAGTHGSAADFRRVEEDVLILSGLGLFFAGVLRAGVLYALFEQTGDSAAGQQALAFYRSARKSWASMAERAKTVYVADVSYGSPAHRRGHWSDRLPAIDTDLAAMEKKVTEKSANSTSASAAIRAVTTPGQRPSTAGTHTVPPSFHPGADLPLALTVPAGAVTGVTLWYRHVNQGERWASTPMQQNAGHYQAVIPGQYTQSPYPLQYYFECTSAKAAWLHPAFNVTLSNQPYYAIHKRT
jgi:hypothetical protein